MSEKIKVLAWMDYTAETGFANVASNIWKRLYATGKYELDVIGVNFSGDPYDGDKWPGNVYTAMSGLQLQPPYNDPYGRQKLLDLLGSKEYDILFLLNDTFIVQTMMDAILETQFKHKHPFRIIYYFPIDASPKKEWITNTASRVNFPITYTNYAYNECVKHDPKLSDKLRVIYHGHDFSNYNYIEDRIQVAKFKHEAFRGNADDKFLIVNVNRNQRRKDIPRSFFILNELKNRGYSDIILYMHMAYDDVGGNLIDMAENFGFEMNKDFLIPDNFNAHGGYPVEVLNHIYNSADCYLTTSLGEGWGLGITEAMSTKLPVVAPDNTAISEILANNRGYLVNSGKNPSMWMIKDNDNDRLRPLMDVEEACDRIIDVYNNKMPDIEGAYNWVKNNNWDIIAKQWDELMDEAMNISATKIPPIGLNRQQRRAMQKGKR